MESKNERLDPSKDFVMENLTSIDPGDGFNDQEKSDGLMHHSFFHNTFSRSTLKDVKNRMKEQAKNVTASRVITIGIILFIIAVFSIPVILYYTYFKNWSNTTSRQCVEWCKHFHGKYSEHVLCHVKYLHVAT